MDTITLIFSVVVTFTAGIVTGLGYALYKLKKVTRDRKG